VKTVKPLLVSLRHPHDLGLLPSELRALVAANQIEIVKGSRGRQLVRVADVEAALARRAPALAVDVESMLAARGYR